MAKITVKKLKTPYDANLANARASLVTPKQERTTASQQASAQITKQLGASNASSSIEQAGYLNLANRAAGIASALGNYGPQMGTNDFNVYNKAAQTVGQLGTGLTGAVAKDWQAEQAANQATIDKTLGPGVGQVSSYDPAALHSALQYTGVTLPGSGLAAQAITARDMARYGAMADKAQIGSIAQDYISQAKAALDQRTAERASIVAQRPELYQTALNAQREDNARTQTRVDNLVNASASYLQNQSKLDQAKKAQAQAQKAQTHTELIQDIATTHIDPRTGQPVGGWTWLDATHSTVVPWAQKIAAQQTNKQIAQRGRQLDITQQHYNKMFTLGQRQADAKAVAAAAPGKFDRYMSGAIGYISDGYGRPITDASGRLVPYKTPGKTAKSMTTEQQLKIRGAMSSYADNLFAGATDPKTGQPTVEKVDLQTAINKFAARGFLQGKLRPWGALALAQSYNVPVSQVIQIANGINPETGRPFGAFGPDISERDPGKYGADTHPKTDDPRFVSGKPWDAKLDPADHYVGSQIVTKSGHIVDRGKYVS